MITSSSFDDESENVEERAIEVDVSDKVFELNCLSDDVRWAVFVETVELVVISDSSVVFWAVDKVSGLIAESDDVNDSVENVGFVKLTICSLSVEESFLAVVVSGNGTCGVLLDSVEFNSLWLDKTGGLVIVTDEVNWTVTDKLVPLINDATKSVEVESTELAVEIIKSI